MPVDYNKFAKTFAHSRKNMKWHELEYFFSLLKQGSILDIWCGSWRLLEQYYNYFWNYPERYLWLDLSEWLLQEAKNIYPNMQFLEANMLDIRKICQWRVFDNVFLIASFHHLQTLQERKIFLSGLYSVLELGATVYMTNWALSSQLNQEKYKSSQIIGSENQYGSHDYSIKIGNDMRYYHSFSLDELEYLSLDIWFTLQENKLFEWGRNIITILKK